jgi:hypothetical protein
MQPRQIADLKNRSLSAAAPAVVDALTQEDNDAAFTLARCVLCAGALRIHAMTQISVRILPVLVTRLSLNQLVRG